MNKEKQTFTITNEKGEDITCEALFTFESDETKKNYIVYTDNSLDKDNNIKVYAAIYDPQKDNSPLQPITTKKEWDIIENILKSLQEK